jgi:hypothetical protein
MNHPTPSDFSIDVTDARVNVIFRPSGRLYTFGRLVDPEDIAHFGPLCRALETNGQTGDTGAYSGDEVAQMAHTLAVQAATSSVI